MANTIYKAFHSKKIGAMKYKLIDYLTVYLMYVPNLESNPLPPKELQCDGWNT